MSDEAVLLPKWSPDWRIILAKYKLGQSYTFWNIFILIFSPIQIIIPTLSYPITSNFGGYLGPALPTLILDVINGCPYLKLLWKFWPHTPFQITEVFYGWLRDVFQQRANLFTIWPLNPLLITEFCLFHANFKIWQTQQSHYSAIFVIVFVMVKNIEGCYLCNKRCIVL